MAYLNPLIYDNGLTYLTTNGNRLDICIAEPANFEQATSTLSLGRKLDIEIGSPEEMTSVPGRRVVVPEITDGEVLISSTSSANDAEFWAVTDTVNLALLATGPLLEADLVTAGDGFTLTPIGIGLPYPA